MTPEERNTVIEALEAVNNERVCDAVHHAKKDLHQFDEPCPVVARISAALAIMRRESGPSMATAPGYVNRVHGCHECGWGKVAGCWRCGSR